MKRSAKLDVVQLISENDKMAKLVYFKLTEGNFEEGFPVSLQIFNESDRKPLADADGRLPPMTDLPKHYHNWQSNFRIKVSGRYSGRMTVESTSDTKVLAEIRKAKQQLHSSINNWFGDKGDFQPIWEQILKTLDKNEEIRVIFKTKNPDLQRLPLFLWDGFFEYYHRAEVGLYLPVQPLPPEIDIPKKVKVLAIFGHEEIIEELNSNVTKIDLDKDWQLLTKLLSEESNAELIRLKEPTLDELGDEIEAQNPQILFFAGHSRSKANEAQGLIQLNKTQTITIKDLKFELIKAVKRGLQLAIFNSCDGIGIAEQLSRLEIANIIVMREPVPDEVAQKFLQRFLEAFAAGKSLGLAVRRARERINRCERKFPGATWLPMIWQDPSKSHLTWQDLGGLVINRQSKQATQKSETRENTQIPWLETAVIKPAEQTKQESPTLIVCSNCRTEVQRAIFCTNCGVQLNLKMTQSPETGVATTQTQVTPSQSSVSSNNKTKNYQQKQTPSNNGNNKSQASANSKRDPELIGGHYRIIDCLRKTGFSETYVAQDTHLPSNPRCIVKKLQPQSNEDFVLNTARRLFRNEASVLYKLNNHPQIPRLLAHIEEDEQFYLVQEFIEGKDLSQTEIVPDHLWQEEEVVTFLREVLEILAFVHQNNVIHRDIKPSNLMRRKSDGKIILIDFGAVKEITNMTLTVGQTNILTVAIGTPGYMASEQQRGDPRFNSDIYALSMTAIQAITGFHPDQLPRDEQTGELSWRDKAPNCSLALADILDKMVRNDFRERYQNANEVLRDLNNEKLTKDGETIITNSNPWKNITTFFTKIMRD